MILVVGDAYRQYSIATPSQITTRFSLLVELLEQGVGSDFFRDLKVGQEALFKGPAGIFVYKKTGRLPLYLATGTGLAPILSMIETNLLNKDTIEMNLFWGLKSRSDTYLVEKLQELSVRHSNFHPHVCLSREQELADLDPKLFALGRVTVSLEAFWQQDGVDPLIYDYYVCGSQKIVTGITDFLKQQSIPKEQIIAEKFTL
ncbi:MAG: Methane monooxygenase component C [Microgenomates bacterium OLB22]|nr:MAG: Methane monooxygenase component C [Microgenomates bacterium OLB22]